MGESTEMLILIIISLILILISLLLLIKIQGISKILRGNNNDEEVVLQEIERQKKELQATSEREKNEIIRFMEGQSKLLSDIINNNIMQMSTQVNNLNVQNDKKLEDIRITMERQLKALQYDNNLQLEKMRGTVDEKLQKTLEEQIGHSFKLVSDRLEMVYKGLGEMQTLATGVGDLKKVLTNVKTRGILGEIQLGSILTDILPKEQFEENVKVSPDRNNFVEFAIKLPGDGEGSIFLPIDAKFPGDAYAALRDAYDSGDNGRVLATKKILENSLKKSAKDISEKYIQPPYTTDFAIMFLPFEGLYAEAINMGLVETLQRDYKINIAGPTTMAALLNSLQMGFKTLAIQKSSSKVWDVLGAVKNEFAKFEKVIVDTQAKINQANDGLEKLVGTRTRMINNKLKDVTVLTDDQSGNILEITQAEAELVEE